MKLLYTHYGLRLNHMLYFYAAGTILIHIQTLFFTPKSHMPKEILKTESYSVFEESIIGHICQKKTYHSSAPIKNVDHNLAKRRVSVSLYGSIRKFILDDIECISKNERIFK